MPRVLICYLVNRSGHHSAALAVERAILAADSTAETRCINLLEYCHPRWEKVIQKTYLTTIRTTPELWDALYDSVWVERLTRHIRRLAQRGTSKSLMRLMNEFQPETVVCTQAHPLAVLAAYSARHCLNVPLWGVVTDFVPHRFWVVNGGNINYVVPTESAADRLMWLGVPADRIHVLGIPVSVSPAAGTSESSERNGHRVLVMGGSRGLGVRYRTVVKLDQSRADFTIDVICGTNNRIREKLLRNRRRFHHALRVRGYVHDAVSIMRRASLLITKPGGLTSAEAMALGLPMLLVRPLPGQERNNARVMVQHGAALHLEREDDVPVVVTTLLNNPALLLKMRARARALGRPDAAARIAAAVLNNVKNRPAQWSPMLTTVSLAP